jgi:hypothetical protein
MEHLHQFLTLRATPYIYHKTMLSNLLSKVKLPQQIMKYKHFLLQVPMAAGIKLDGFLLVI